MLVHHGKIVQGAYGLNTPRSLTNLPAKTLLSNHIWLKLALPTSFTILLVHHFAINLNNCSPFESKTYSTASAFFIVFSISSIPPLFTDQHSKRREFSLLIFHMIRDLQAISWSLQLGCFTMADPCKKSSSNESRKIFSSIPLGDTHHKTSSMVSRHSCFIGSIWFQNQVSMLTVTLSFRF